MNAQKTGRAMMFMACVLGLALLTMFFSSALERQRNPNQNPVTKSGDGVVEVVLQRNRQGHYVLTGMINGRSVEFLLDTGATDVVLPEAIATQLGLEAGRAGRAMTANGTVTVYETRLNHLQLGDIRLSNVRASINPAMPSPAILLGMSALKQIEFVQRGDTLTLRQYR
ncbi:MAG: TIGR02281 family clan AA aspartic protease [Gammaproteobacteria bacterium]|nr:TIGR02281 family clan AA aspartic protease [Gammaproteobacteria bacterium]